MLFKTLIPGGGGAYSMHIYIYINIEFNYITFVHFRTSYNRRNSRVIHLHLAGTSDTAHQAIS